jgi:hypothetical protein
MTARYVYFTIPLFFVFSAFSIEMKKFKKEIRWILYISIVLALACDLLILFNIEKAFLPRSERSGYLEEWTAGAGIKEASEIVRERYMEGENNIVVGTEGHFGTLPDGFQMYLNDIPEINVFGVGIDLDIVPESLVESKKADNNTYLLINSSRMLFDYKKENLDVVGVWPKAKRPSNIVEYSKHGERDYLYLFKLR